MIRYKGTSGLLYISSPVKSVDYDNGFFVTEEDEHVEITDVTVMTNHIITIGDIYLKCETVGSIRFVMNDDQLSYYKFKIEEAENG